ncbi:VOC family protein [Micromonospora sp. FIMYZ51]|uniref:VOC family protein n=1 Tax=Micromonospora sp. FIMYZ51 TaxID=3051832 RepID=UPI00311E8B59
MSVVRVTGFDHLVLTVTDVERALDFYCGRLGLAPVRVDEWRAGKVPFPSVRVSAESIIDLVQAEPAARQADGQVWRGSAAGGQGSSGPAAGGQGSSGPAAGGQGSSGPAAGGQVRRGVNVDHFCLVVEPLDWSEVLASGRFEVLAGPVGRFGARGSATSVYVRDPDGNCVELRWYPQDGAGRQSGASPDQSSVTAR